MDKKVSILMILTCILFVAQISIVNAAYLTTDTERVENLVDITDIIEKEWLKLIDSTQFNPLNSPNFNIDKKFLWSPDGSKLLVLVKTYITTKNISMEDKKFAARCSTSPFGLHEETSALFWINADGSELNKIARAETSIRTVRNNTANNIESAEWNLNGDKIVLKVKNPCNEKPYNLYVSDINGSILAEVKDVEYPFMLWNPTGNKVVVSESKANSQILTLDLQNSSVKQVPLSVSIVGYNGIAWHPDGEKIAIIDNKNGEIYTADVDTFSIKQLTTDTQAKELKWKTDGKKLVFAAENGIYVIGADGSNLALIEKGNFGLVSWSPDGKRLLSIKRNEKGDSEGLQVFDIDSGITKLIDVKWVNSVTWNPSSDRIAFRSDSSSSIYTVNSDGTYKVTLPNSYSTDIEGVYSWGLDNRVYYLTNDSLVKIYPDGTELIPLVKNLSTDAYSHNQIYLSSDGSRILFTVFNLNDKREHIYVLKMKGYDEVMSVYVPGHIREGDEAFIEVNSMSKPVENAVIALNGEEIGITNKTGVLKYSFEEAGNYRLSAVKQGFRTANKSIMIKEQSLEQTADTITHAPVAVENTPQTPGFNSIFAVFAFILTIYPIKKIRRIK